MNLLLNDLSLHEQFPDLDSFRHAVSQVVALRHLASRFGHQLNSHPEILNCRINSTTSLYEALQRLPRDEKQSILRWLTRHGPFWNDDDEHSSDLFIFFGDEIVTGTAVGQAAFCEEVGICSSLISFEPSKWQISPIDLEIGQDKRTRITVPNFWRVSELDAALREAEPPISTWPLLEERSRVAFQRIVFAPDCFSYLDGQPFAPGAASRIQSLLGVLDRLIGSVDSSGKRTSEGHRIYQDHFTGDRAWFSDSSETDKARFESELTFPNPQVPGGQLFCPWHGKVNNPPLRLHFAWPSRPGDPVCVAYIGLKITRR